MVVAGRWELVCVPCVALGVLLFVRGLLWIRGGIMLKFVLCLCGQCLGEEFAELV